MIVETFCKMLFVLPRTVVTVFDHGPKGTDFANKAKRQWKHLYLVFPEDHELSAKEIYTDAGEDSELDIEIVPIRTDMQAEKGTDLQHWAAWKVARVDISPVKRGKIDSTTKKLSKAAALAEKLYFAGMKEE
jgi:hypothetical protein